MGVTKDRTAVARIERIAAALTGGPTVIGARNSFENCLPAAVTDVVNENAARAWLDSERERIAQAQRPGGTVDTGGRAIKGVVRRNRAIRVNAQHLSERVRERLRVGRVAVITDGEIKLPVTPEVSGAAIMVVGNAQVI